MNRLEEHIKSKLHNREITPSSDAWKKISKELNQSGTSRPTKKGFWWAIAAGIVGVALVSITFFNDDKIMGTNEVLVFEKEKKSDVEENSNTLLNDESVSLPEERLVVEVGEAEKTSNKNSHGLNEDISIQVASNEVADETEILNDGNEVTDLAINSKLEEIMEHVNAMENNAITVSDAEIDSLLMAAQRELLTEKAFVQNDKVDAMALLNEVEMELYDDQRNPLFIKLKEGFFKLRTAVADRNN